LAPPNRDKLNLLALQSEDHGAVSLAIVGTLAGTTIVKQLRRFSARHRKARLELRTANSFEVSDMVRRGEVSLGLRYFGDPFWLVDRRLSVETQKARTFSPEAWRIPTAASSLQRNL